MQSPNEITAWCRELAACSDVPGATTRTFLSPATHAAHRLVTESMAQAGLSVFVDAAGNVRGLYSGSDRARPRLLIGSHIDTVLNAGAFDGVLGVALGIALIERLHGRRLAFAIEVVAFSEEEGVRFNVPFIGSRALAGTLDAQLLERKDASGVTVQQAIRDFGLDFENLKHAALDNNVAGYLEFHIEQGPLLEHLGSPLGVVEAIAGQSRTQIRFVGAANHAGTTPMHLRKDALTAAAEWITLVEREAGETPGLVATVGRIEANPGVGNVIAGEVVCSLDVRHADDPVRVQAQRRMIVAAQAIASARGITVDYESRLEQRAVAMDVALTATLVRAATSAGLAVPRMVSGAGHDAMIFAPKLPAAMLFLRSPGGISHHPAEAVLPGDIEAALAVGMRFLEIL